MNKMHEDNRVRWNAWAPRWKELKETMDWDRCHLDPTIRFGPVELETMGDVSEEWGKAEWDDSPASRVPGAFYIVGNKRSSQR